VLDAPIALVMRWSSPVAAERTSRSVALRFRLAVAAFAKQRCKLL
jgi:hypothetical protein